MIARYALLLFPILLCGNVSAIEKMRGYVRQTQIFTCINGCDYFHLDPDSGYTFIYLRADPNSSVNLTPYVDMHVEVAGFRGGCGGCVDLYVSTVQVLSTSGVADDQIIPDLPHLRQNYPNPFNPATTIEYSLKKEANVMLKVFDILGHEVSTLVASNQHAGLYRIVWDASGQPDGIYFYRLLASGPDRRQLIQARAMILLR